MERAGRILIVDDDESVRQAIADYLGRHGYEVQTADGAAQMDAALGQAPFDLIVLDLMMPGEGGLAICQRLGAQAPPILMLSALGGTTDRIVGLEVGAADYLAKPFDPRELLARVRAVARTARRGSVPPPAQEETAFRFEGWRFDPEARTLHDPEGREVILTPNEHALLRAFAERPGRLLTRDALLELTQGRDPEPFDRAIDLAVSRLRRKLGAGGGMIETLRGEGYRFRPHVQRA